MTFCQGRMMKILIADDSKLSRAKLRDALKDLGHNVVEAESGEEAITLFKSECPDLIILDVVMEGMSGFECATIVRNLDKENWIPIIFLSSTLDDDYISKGIDAGGDDYLTKPFSSITLSAKIKAMQRISDMRAELIKTTKKLDQLSTTDSLTGLNNRLKFEERLNEAFQLARRYQQKFALFFIDIDNFKTVNDKLGHHFGDLLLKAVATNLSSCLRTDDFLARVGGDEFALIVQPIENHHGVEALAKKIINLGTHPYTIEKKSIFITISIGIAGYPEAGTDAETLLVHADLAMYAVKKKGRNNYQIYNPDIKP